MQKKPFLPKLYILCWFLIAHTNCLIICLREKLLSFSPTMSPPTYFPLRWESTGDQWWYASPIDWAAANGHYDLVRELLRLDGNHLIKLTSLRRIRRLETVWDDEEQFHDVAKCRSDVAKQLLNECGTRKSSKNSLIGAGYGGWLLYTAASAGDLSFVKQLLVKDPLLVFGEGEYGVTDILYAAAKSKNSEVFKVVFDYAASPRFIGGGGVVEEDLGGVPAGYKLEILNRALHAAARGGNVELLKELLSDCLDGVLAYRDSKGATLLHAAAARGQVEVVKHLASSPEIVESIDNLGNTALHIAAQRGHLPVVEALILASPLSVIATTNAGETFLHAVVAGFQTPGFRRLDRQIDLLKQLLSGKLFSVQEIVNLKNKDGRTALHLAIMGNVHLDLVQLLMSIQGINVNVRDTDGNTPLDILRQRPSSVSSDMLTRQLISAGGILSSHDYSTRRAIASHIKRQSVGGSPGTSFRISDVEIFLYTGVENASDGCRSVGPSFTSPEQNHPCQSSQQGSNMEKHSPISISKPSSANHTAERLKRLLHWPKKKASSSDMIKGTSTNASTEVPLPLRQRFSKPSSLPNNKRALSVRSDVPSPTAKKKLASGIMHGVMQAIPFVVPHRSRSSSFSKMSMSSHSSLDMQKGNEIDYEMAKASCCNQTNAEGAVRTSRNKRLMNQLCFGAPGRDVGARMSGSKPYDVYERSVLSAA